MASRIASSTLMRPEPCSSGLPGRSSALIISRALIVSGERLGSLFEYVLMCPNVTSELLEIAANEKPANLCPVTAQAQQVPFKKIELRVCVGEILGDRRKCERIHQTVETQGLPSFLIDDRDGGSGTLKIIHLRQAQSP